jgi:hypothetical protein
VHHFGEDECQWRKFDGNGRHALDGAKDSFLALVTFLRSEDSVLTRAVYLHKQIRVLINDALARLVKL